MTLAESKPSRTKEEVAARIERMMAETERIKAEAEKAKAEGEKARYEAALAEQEAEQGRLATMKRQIDFDREYEKRQRELSDDKYHRIYNFKSVVENGAVSRCMDELTYWHRTAPGCDIDVIFYSPGGDVIDGFALWDFLVRLRREGHKLTTGCVGYAASMAGILLQAGDVRWMGAESYMLIHEAAFMAAGKLGEVEDRVEWVHKIQDRVLDIFAQRSKLSKGQIRRRWRRKDWWIDSSEALKLGFVDEVR